MGYSKVDYNGETLMDISKDTVTPETLGEGVTAHDSNGDPIVGVAKAVKNETNPTTINANGYDIPTGGYSHINVKVDPPEGYVDTSGATAGAYDIYYGKTAFVNGSLVTGAYRMVGRNGGFQVNSGSAGCSSSRLVISCPFKPTHVCIILNAGTHNTNTVIAAFFGSDSVTYHSRTSSGVIRNQYTTSLSNYWSYDATNEQVIVQKPNTTYSWSAQNYRYFCFK